MANEKTGHAKTIQQQLSPNITSTKDLLKGLGLFFIKLDSREKTVAMFSECNTVNL